MKKYSYLLLMLLSVFSCATSNMEKLIIEGYDKNINEENSPQSSFIKGIEVIPLKSRDNNAILSNPEKVVLYDNHFYIMDNNKILCYNINGDFIRFIGEKGHGHGEYINLASFVVCNDTIKLLDSFKNTLLAYSLQGDFLYEKKAPEGVLSNVKDAVYEENNQFFMSNYIYNEQNDVYTRWDTSSNEVSIVANAKVQTKGAKEFVGAHSFCMYGNNIRYVLPFSDMIMSTKDSIMQFNTSRKVLKDDELRKILDFSIVSYANHSENFTGFCNIFETHNYLLLTFFNLEYTVVDKRSYECFRYPYRINEKGKDFPLLNILSSDKETLIGIVNWEEFQSLEGKIKNYREDYKKLNCDYAIIMYHTK